MAASRADPETAFAAAQELQRAGRLAEADRAWQELLKLIPGHPGGLANHAMVLWQLGRHADAEEAATEALRRDPAMVQAQAIAAACAEARGADGIAIQRYQRALELKPDLATALHALSNLYLRNGDIAEAREAAERMAAAAPLSAQAWDTLGAIRLAQDDLIGAEQALSEALRLDPDFASARANLGTVMAERRDWAKALQHADAALAIDDRLKEAHNNRANALSSLGREAEAEAALERAISLNPDNAEALFNRALLWLRQGRWPEAWPGFESRWRLRRMQPWRRKFDVPQWDGAEAPGKTLLVHAEQGIGDTIMMARYLAPAARRVGRVVLECAPELVSLMAAMPNMAERFECVATGAAVRPFDFHVPAMSLPGVFATMPETVPWDGPYVAVPGAAQTGGPLNVGLCWAGNPRNSADPDRSAPLAALAPILSANGCAFHSLQHGPEGDQIAAAGLAGRIVDHRAELTDFAATAALISNMDLVISVCTSVAHLSGAMGRPLWVLLCADADWRWLRGRDDTPWYPGAKLYRQAAAGDWGELAARVGVALEEYGKSGGDA